jgi:hypothetical protein
VTRKRCDRAQIRARDAMARSEQIFHEAGARREKFFARFPRAARGKISRQFRPPRVLGRRFVRRRANGGL